MAAGLGFKNFTSGEVLTAANVNGYLMQGINVFASAAARDAAITAPAEGQFAFTKDTNGLWYYDGAAWVASGATGDIEGVTAGIGISGGGTSGTVTVTNSMATAIDAKGDLIGGTGADAFSRLAVGANDTVLTADSTTATGLKWAAPAAGGMTLIASGSLSGSTTTVSSIPATYEDLVIYVRNFTASATTSAFDFVVNSNLFGYGTGQSNASTSLTTQGGGRHQICENTNSTDFKAHAAITIHDYTNASVPIVTSVSYNKANNSSDRGQFSQSAFPSITAAVNSIGFSAGGNTWTAGTYEVWGRK